MRTVALVSGGKDSCFNMLQCVAAGHEIVALANLRPPIHVDKNQGDEMDSYMYQTVGHDAIGMLAEAMGLPLYREFIIGSSLEQGSDYLPTNEEDEVEDLYRLLVRVKEAENIEAVSVGAILSNYQRVRVENVCKRLSITSLAYLWRQDQEELLEEIIQSHVHAKIIKVAALGLQPSKHLGKSLKECQPELLQLSKKFGLNVCGEGGEYETLTLDCPLFQKKIIIEDLEIIPHSTDPFAPVAYLRFPKLRLADKECDTQAQLEAIRKPIDFCIKELEYHPNEFSAAPIDRDIISFSDNEIDDLPLFATSSQTDTGTIFVSGLQIESEKDFEEIMNKLEEILQKHGSNLTSLASVCLYVRDMADYPQINELYNKYFNLNPPVRVCIQVPIKHYAMIEAVAVQSCNQKSTMHVQSVSHWAPANIGPYSQCVQLGNVLMVSGQIGLIPGSMTLPQPSNFGAECRLALRHTSRVLAAMDKEVSLYHTLQAVCFIRHEGNIPLAKSIWKEYGGRADQGIAFAVVTNLPRNALVEWQVWAHRPTDTDDAAAEVLLPLPDFGCVHITKHDNAATVICNLDELASDPEMWANLHDILSKELGPECTLRIYYKVDLEQSHLKLLTEAIPKSACLTLVPVWGLESKRVATICGIRI